MNRRGQNLRRELYEMVRRQVEARLGRLTPELKRYQNVYESEFKNKNWKASEIGDLLEQIQQSQLLLLGDFHGIKQSQKSHLRLLRKLKNQHRRIVLGLECLEAKDTPILQKYLSGQISEKDFLRKVKWSEKWGFPWDHYKQLIDWVDSQGGLVYGVNKASVHSGKQDLKHRDQTVAKSIVQLMHEHKKDLVVIVFGEMHLAKSHLVGSILQQARAKKQTVKFVRVFQNPEELYFKFLSSADKTPQVLRNTSDTFSLLNVPPWVKWQSYLLYLDQAQDFVLDDDDDWDDEEYWDFSDEVAQMARILGADLGLAVKEDELAVGTLFDEGFEKSLQKRPIGERKILKSFIKQEIPFLLHGTAANVYLPRMSVNHAAQAAMLFLAFHGHRDMKTPWEFPRDFLKLIWISAWVYFGSKLINPRRKADTFKDIQARLQSPDEKEQGKEALKIALFQKSRELSGILNDPARTEFIKQRANISALVMAAELLGKIHGEKLYAGWSQRKLGPVWIHRSLKSSLKPTNLPKSYYALVKKLEGISTGFNSKAEKI